jgi:hypothetical protein
MSRRQCYIIPHPADIKRLKSLTPKKKTPFISTVWRRYDNFLYIPSLVVNNLGPKTRLIGYDREKDPKVWLTTTLYDVVLQGTNYFDFCDQLRESQVVFDPFTFHSYSRTTVDTAAMGVPVVGSNRTQSMNVCYPHTMVDPYDVQSARKLLTKVLEDKEFREKVINTAYENVEFYKHENSKERLLSSLSESIKLGRKRNLPVYEKEEQKNGKEDKRESKVEDKS